MSYDTFSKVKRLFFKGMNFKVLLCSKVKDTVVDNGVTRIGFTASTKIKLNNGLVTLIYSPTNSIILEGKKDATGHKDYVAFAIEDYIELLDFLKDAYKSLEIDEMFALTKKNELFVDEVLQKKHTIVFNVYFSNIVIKPAVVETFDKPVEGVILQINNGSNIEIPHYELKKLIKLIDKTDMVLLSEQVLTNGLLLNTMDKNEKKLSDFAQTKPSIYDPLNKNILRGF